MNRAEMQGMAETLFHTARAAAILLLSGTVLGACSPPPKPEGPAPRWLARADPIIVGLQPTPKGVRVIARIEQPDLAGDTIRIASKAVRQLVRAVQAGAQDLPPTATVVTFDLYGVDVDKFGKRTPARFFESDFYVDDMRGLDLRHKGPAAVLDTAIDLREDKAGIDPLNAWCMRYPHVGASFCTMAGD
jgi:hypothetical protein